MHAGKVLLLLQALLAWAIASRVLDQEWNLWKSKHEKKYVTAQEEDFRRGVWEATWKKVMSHNLEADRGNKSFRMAMNHFADMSAEERNSKGCLMPSRREGKPVETRKYKTNVQIPKEVDWRKEKCVTPVKNQGGFCGSCWAFATVGVLESRYCIKHKQLFNLSEQQLVDCDMVDQGCCGGLPKMAFAYVSENGIMKSEDYEYSEHKSTCLFNHNNAIKLKVPKFYVLPEESNMAAAVAFDGPVTVGFAVTEEFQLYEGGIYDGACAEEANHAIIVVGYGTQDGEDYWIIKNSWGPEWGDNGYAKVKRNENHCKIAEEAATADVLGPGEDMEEY